MGEDISMRLKIPNIDRVGLVLDISQRLAARHINIISMEVELKTVYLETQIITEGEGAELIQDLESIPGVVQVEAIDLMPHQEKSEQLKAVLDSASEGIIAIDRHHQALDGQAHLAGNHRAHHVAKVAGGHRKHNRFARSGQA